MRQGGKIQLMAEECESNSSVYAKYRFLVIDNGMGISADFKDTILDTGLADVYLDSYADGNAIPATRKNEDRTPYNVVIEKPVCFVGWFFLLPIKDQIFLSPWFTRKRKYVKLI